MIINIKRKTSWQTSFIAGPGVGSIDIIEQPAEKKAEAEYWLLVSGVFQRQWFVARRNKSKLAELEKIRDDIGEGLKKNTDVTVEGDDLPSITP